MDHNQLPLGHSKRLSSFEVQRRVEVLRKGCQQSRAQFGELTKVRWKGQVVVIYTTRHDIHISADLWKELGTHEDEEQLQNLLGLAMTDKLN